LNIYRTEFFSICPSNGVRIKYALEIATSEVIPVEQIIADVESRDTGYHEEHADQLHRTFGGNQRLIADHHSVSIETIRSVSGDEDCVTIPRSLIGAACSAIDKKRDAPNVLTELRRYTVGDLSNDQRADQPSGELGKSAEQEKVLGYLIGAGNNFYESQPDHISDYDWQKAIPVGRIIERKS
jgi:hypothetical protein